MNSPKRGDSRNVALAAEPEALRPRHGAFEIIYKAGQLSAKIAG
jgi:hypothetical protein